MALVPYPGSAERNDDLCLDPSEVEDFIPVLEWMAEKDHGVTSRDMWEDDEADTRQQASRTLGALWKTTGFVDRVEFRQRISDGTKNVAHVYWLTDAGRTAARTER